MVNYRIMIHIGAELFVSNFLFSSMSIAWILVVLMRLKVIVSK